MGLVIDVFSLWYLLIGEFFAVFKSGQKMLIGLAAALAWIPVTFIPANLSQTLSSFFASYPWLTIAPLGVVLALAVLYAPYSLDKRRRDEIRKRAISLEKVASPQLGVHDERLWRVHATLLSGDHIPDLICKISEIRAMDSLSETDLRNLTYFRKRAIKCMHDLQENDTQILHDGDGLEFDLIEESPDLKQWHLRVTKSQSHSGRPIPVSRYEIDVSISGQNTKEVMKTFIAEPDEQCRLSLRESTETEH